MKVNNRYFNENQNNIQSVQKPKMTTEELEKTHVLNLSSFQETVRFEKMTSKKPALIIAIIGFVAILTGTVFQVAQNLAVKHEEEKRIEQRRLEKKKVPTVTTEYMNCKYYVPNNPNGTDYLMEINYGFSNQKLTEFTKKFTVVATPNNPIGPSTIDAYLNDYKLFMNPIDGYQISVTPTTNTGFITVVKVDYNLLDLTLLSPRQKDHFSTSVDYTKNSTQKEIKENMLKQGYTCE